MRILQVHNRYQQPGGEDVVADAERALLEAAGHEVVAYARHNDEIATYGVWRRATLPARTVWAWDSRREIAALIRRERPDVAHFHNTFPLVSPAAYTACREAGVPVVQTVQNYRLVCPAATLRRAGRVCEECLAHGLGSSLRHACYRDSRLATAAVAGMLHVHRRRGTWESQVDLYVAATRFSRDTLVRGGLPADRVVVKPNFLDPAPEPREGDGRYALFLGRLAEEKGLRTLAEAWGGLAEPVPLVVAGDGPLRAELSATLGGRPEVRLLGAVARERVLALLRGARFLLVPSEWYEGFPMTVVEALACGVPVLASDLGGLAEIVADGRTGRLVPPGEPAAWAEAALRAWREPEGLRALGKAGRADFETHYTAERNLEALLAIYARARG